MGLISDSVPDTDELKAIPERARSGIENALDESRKRVVAVGTAVAAFSAVLLGHISPVAWITAIPEVVWGVTTAGAAAGTGWLITLLNSWGMSILATGIAIVADRPWIAGVLVFAGIVAWVGPEGFRDDFKAVIQYLLLAVLGYVVALTLGGGLLQNFSILVVVP